MYFLSQAKCSVAHYDKLGKLAEATKWQLSIGGALCHSADFPVALDGLFTILPLEKAASDFTCYSQAAAL